MKKMVVSLLIMMLVWQVNSFCSNSSGDNAINDSRDNRAAFFDNRLDLRNMFQAQESMRSDQPDNDPEDETYTYYHSSQMWQGMLDVYVDGNYAYCAMYDGLMITGAFPPGAQVVFSNFPVEGGQGWRLDKRNYFIYMASGDAGLVIIDVFDMNNPNEISRLDIDGYCFDVKLKDDLAVLAAGSQGLVIADISDIENPHIISDLPSNDIASAVAIDDTYAYLADGDAGLKIIEISDPQDPQLVSSLDVGGFAFDIDINKAYAYIAVEEIGPVVIDISDPENPLKVSNSLAKTGANGITVADDYAFVTLGGENGLRIFDISDPANLSLVKSVEIPGSTVGIYLYDSKAYVAGWNQGLSIVDFSDVSNADIVGFLDSYGNVIKADFYGEILVTASSGWQTGNGIFHVGKHGLGNWYHDIFRYKLDGPAATDLVIDGNFAFVTDIYNGFDIIDLSIPDDIFRVGRYISDGVFTDIAINGDYAYLADDESGIHIVNLENIAAPRLAGLLDFGEGVIAMTVSGGMLYIGSADLISAYDLTDPINPVFAFDITLDYNLKDFKIENDYLYAALQSRGLEIFDVSNPQDIRDVAVFSESLNPGSVSIDSIYLLLTDPQKGVYFYNISDPENIYLAGRQPTQGLAQDAAWDGNGRIAIADYYGLYAYDALRPLAKLNNNQVFFTANENGYTPATQSFSLANENEGRLIWSLTKSKSWLQLSPVEGDYETMIDVSMNIDNLTQGNYTDTIRINGNASNMPLYVEVNLLVNPPNDPPSLSELAPRTFNEGGFLSMFIEANDPDGTSPMLRTSELPENASFTDNGNGSGRLEFAPDYHQSGQYRITFTAVDEIDTLLQSSMIVEIIVLNVNRAPSFTGLTETIEITEDDTLEFIIEADDPDGDPVKLYCLDKPANATFRDRLDGSGLFLLHSDYSNAGQSYELRFQVLDTAEAITNQTITLNVKNRLLQVSSFFPSPPQQGVTDILISDKIIISFNEQVDPISLNNRVILQSAKDNPLIYTYDPDLTALIIASDADLFSEFDTIKIKISDQISDLAGFIMGREVHKTFHTGTAVYPGDLDHDGRVDERDLLPLGLGWQVEGPIREGGNDCSWGSYPAHVWENAGNTYADANGDGIIDADDICGIAQNWDRMIEIDPFEKKHELNLLLKDFDTGILNGMYFGLLNCDNSPGKSELLNILQSLMDNKSQNLPQQFSLDQNYPNPFNPETTISFSLPENAHVSIEIFDLTGRKVTTLLNRNLQPGQHSVTWNATDSDGEYVSSGIYFYRLTSGQKSTAKKMILLK